MGANIIMNHLLQKLCRQKHLLVWIPAAFCILGILIYLIQTAHSPGIQFQPSAAEGPDCYYTAGFAILSILFIILICLSLTENQYGSLSLLLPALAALFSMIDRVIDSSGSTLPGWYLANFTEDYAASLPLLVFLSCKTIRFRKIALPAAALPSLHLLSCILLELAHRQPPEGFIILRPYLIHAAFLAAIITGILEFMMGTEFYRKLGWFAAGTFITLALLWLGSSVMNGSFTDWIEIKLALIWYGNLKTFRQALTIFFLIGSFAVSFLEFVYTLIRERSALRTAILERQYALSSIENMRESIDQIRGIKHDMLNHLQAVRTMLQNEETEKAASYIDHLIGETAAVPLNIYTDNALVNALLCGRLADAQKEGIRIERDIALPSKLPFADADLCSILGNLLDNALEACTLVTPGQNPFIKIIMHIRTNHLYIQMDNAAPCKIRPDSITRLPVTAKSDKEVHGYGLKTVKRLAEKYNGLINIISDDTSFSICIALCLESV